MTEDKSSIQSLSMREKLASIMWRGLSRYGRIKYRYLLPIYRVFGHEPGQRKSEGQQSITLRSARALNRFVNPASLNDQLQAVIARIAKSNGAIIFLPSVGWNVVNTQRSQHLAREFARQGFVVIFDSSDSFDDVSSVREIESNLFLIREPDQALSQIESPILWSFPHNYQYRDAYPSSARLVYDWIDDFEVFNFERKFLEDNHARALKEASLILTVAHTLHDRAKDERPDTLYLPNGVDYEHFAGASAVALNDPDIPHSWLSGKPLAGYYGALAEWFDYDLLREVAQQRSDWNFIMIGPMYDNSLRDRGQSLLKLENVRWIGARDYQVLPQYLALFDVSMIPFVINNITRATSPLKLYEYFAGGKPVVTTPMPECETFAEVITAQTAAEFSDALDLARARGDEPAFQERLRQLGQENSWTARVNHVLKSLAKAK